MLFEINENCNLAALVIGDELDSGHGLIVPQL
jgi:hypothetical protein